MKYVWILLFILFPSLVKPSHKEITPFVILPEITVRPEMPNADSIYLLARLIQAEANGEPFQGQVAVANTVIYRSWRKGKNYHNIVFQKGQYDGVKSKYFHRKPKPEHLRAAYYALIGYKAVPYGVQYFHNKRIATDTRWVSYLSKHEYKTIGNHTFCWIPRLKPQV